MPFFMAGNNPESRISKLRKLMRDLQELAILNGKLFYVAGLQKVGTYN
jgi:hypothetical protein